MGRGVVLTGSTASSTIAFLAVGRTVVTLVATRATAQKPTVDMFPANGAMLAGVRLARLIVIFAASSGKAERAITLEASV